MQAIGTPGELCLGGIQLARGYFGDAGKTAEKFVTNPLLGHKTDRMYKTGDIVTWLPHGQLLYLGRNDEMVKVRGFRIAEPPRLPSKVCLDITSATRTRTCIPFSFRFLMSRSSLSAEPFRFRFKFFPRLPEASPYYPNTRTRTRELLQTALTLQDPKYARLSRACSTSASCASRVQKT